jgi:hypothetical protein
MAKGTFNSDGVLVNSETGEPIGSKNGNTTNINSIGSEMKTLEDYGVLLPDFPEDDDSVHKEDDEDFNILNAFEDKNKNESSGEKSDRKSSSFDCSSHIDHGVSSFKVKRTKYEVTNDSYFIIRFGLLEKEGGRFVPVKEQAISSFPMCEEHWVKFRMWNYGEELQWKSKFLEYDNTVKIQQINQDKLNEYKIKHLMLDWSFGECDDRLKLLHCDGVLSDESYGIFKGMYPSIATTIVDMMNLVLESNQ